MNISNPKAFFLGGGFDLKVAGYDKQRVSAKEKALSFALSVLLTLATGGLFFIAGPLVGRAIHNRRELNKIETKTGIESLKTLRIQSSKEKGLKALDFSKITPANIDQFLETHEVFFTQAKSGNFHIDQRKNPDTQKIWYNIVVDTQTNKGTVGSYIDITEKNKFRVPVELSSDHLDLDTFKEVLDYYLKLFNLPHLTIKTKEGEEIIYKK